MIDVFYCVVFICLYTSTVFVLWMKLFLCTNFYSCSMDQKNVSRPWIHHVVDSSCWNINFFWVVYPFNIYFFSLPFHGIFVWQKWYPMMSRASWSIFTQLPESCWDTSGPVFQSTPRFWKRRWPVFSVLMWSVTFCLPFSPSAWSCRRGRSESPFVVAKLQHLHSFSVTHSLSTVVVFLTLFIVFPYAFT